MSDPLVEYLAQFKAFDENAHPRGRAGTPTGGKFVPKSGGEGAPQGAPSPGQPVGDLGALYGQYLYNRIGQHPTHRGFRSQVVKPMEHEANLKRGLQRSRDEAAKWRKRLQDMLAKAKPAAASPGTAPLSKASPAKAIDTGGAQAPTPSAMAGAAVQGPADGGPAQAFGPTPDEKRQAAEVRAQLHQARAPAQPIGRRARVEQLRQMIVTLGLKEDESAALADMLADDLAVWHGGFYDFLLAEGVSAKGMFDIHKHAHQPAGSPQGGQFAPTHMGGLPVSGRFPVQMGGGYQVNAAIPKEALIPHTRQNASVYHVGANFYPVYHARSQQHAGYVSRSATGVHGWDYLGQHMGAYRSMDDAANAVVRTHALKPKVRLKDEV